MSRKFTSRGANKELSNEQLEELKFNARGILSNVRRNLLNAYPFLGSVAMTLDIVPVRDIRLETAATDGRNIYFDIDFLSSLTENQSMFVMAHEIFHCILLHLFRGHEYENQTFANLAADMEVNHLLKNDGLSVLENCVLPEKYGFQKGLNMERYYALLMEQDNKQSKQQQGGGNGKGSGSGGKSGQSDQNDQNDQNQSGKRGSSQFDKHITKQEDGGSGEETPSEESTMPDKDGNAIVDKYGRVGLDKDFNPVVKESTKEKIREACVSAAQACERMRGEVPDYAKRLVAEMLKPQIDWKEVLANFINKVNGMKPTWNRPNRRFAYQGTYLPSHEDNQLKAAIVLDTSGSTSNVIPQFLSEVNAIVKMANDYELTIIDIDAEVQKVRKFGPDHPLNLETEKFEVYGGGGTCLIPAFKHIEKEGIEADVIIAFTDGYCEDITTNDVPATPILWVISDKSNPADNLKVGDKTYFEPARK